MKHAGTFFALGLLTVLALTNGQATSTCTITKADIVFVLDASKSVNNNQWKQELAFAKEVVKGFDIGPNKVRVGLVEFSRDATVQARFNKHTNLTSLLSGIDKVGGRKDNGGTRTGLALDLVRTTLLPQKRPNVPFTVIVITDGKSTGPEKENLAAFAALKATKATVFAVGVGNYKEDELRLIASNPKFVYKYADFDKLLQLQQIFKQEACKVVNKLVPSTIRRETPTTPSSQNSTCTIKKADIVFVLDASGSVSRAQWKQELMFAKEVVKGFDIGPNKVRVALVQFSSGATLQAPFNQHTTLKSLLAGIDQVRKSEGTTRTDLALDLVRKSLLPFKRSNVPLTVIVITDGKSNDERRTLQMATALKARDTTVFAVGVGNYKKKELDNIASNPKFVYTYTDFNKLLQLQQIFKDEACKEVSARASACTIKKADIVFVLDASGSVSDIHWEQERTFAKEVVKGFDIGPNKVRVALVQFSSGASQEIKFNQHTNLSSLLSGVDKVQKSGGGTSTDKALDLVRATILPQKRPDVPLTVIIITDGGSNDKIATHNASEALKDTNTTVFAVGVGKFEKTELNNIASDPKFVYTYTDFNKLIKLQQIFKQETCKVVNKLAPTTTEGTPTISSCNQLSLDLVVAVDTSSSVGLANFNLTKSFLKEMFKTMNFGDGYIRVGLIKFNDVTKTEWELDQNNNLTQANEAVDNMKYEDGEGTMISAALRHMRESSFMAKKGDRSGVANVGIIVTDGKSKDVYRTQFEANKTKEANIVLFTVGIGQDIGWREINLIASDPSYVFYVKRYNELAQIRAQLAIRICNGYTLPPTTTPQRPICRDAIDCSRYEDNVCFDLSYRPWAKKNCPAKCDLCPSTMIRYLPFNSCTDNTAANCPMRINVCNDTQYTDWMMANCPAYCGKCGELNKAVLTQKPTTQPTTTPLTTRQTTTTTTTTRAPTTKYTCCDSECCDVIPDCAAYSIHTCRDPIYKAAMSKNCPEYCGVCTPSANCSKPPLCKDNDEVNCSKYSDADCFDPQQLTFMRENCNRKCFCGPNPGTTPPSTKCEDLTDCTRYGSDVCSDYREFTKKNCRATCGYCQASYTTPGVCADKRDCSGYDKSSCVNPDFRKFMLAHCRKFCNLCNAKN